MVKNNMAIFELRSPIEVPNTPRSGIGHDITKPRLEYYRFPIPLAINLTRIKKQALFKEMSLIGFLFTPRSRNSYLARKYWALYRINLVT